MALLTLSAKPAVAYVPLWCKSNYSFLEGASHPEELVDTALASGLGGLSLTDHGMYGAVRAFDRARTVGLPLVLGAQMRVVSSSTLVLLAQTREGYARLCGLLTQSHAQEEPLSFRQVAEHAAELLALWRPESPPVAGSGGISREVELETLSEAFPQRLYALMSRHRWTDDKARERETLSWAEKFPLIPVAATEVLYHTRDRQELQDVLTSIRHRIRLSEAGTRLRPNAEHALKTPAEFSALYADRPAWVEQTREVAARCMFSLGEIEYRYPEEGVPEGQTSESWLRRLVDIGAGDRYQGTIPPQVRAQLDKELALIEDLRYAGYFLTMWEIVQFCRKNGILCQGRGSAANSAVCFCLGITAIDPVRMNLLFERFLSKERAEPPDIDLDIEHHRREEVIQHMYRRYGRHRAAMVANVVRYRSRSALREVGKALAVPEVALDRGSKMLSHHDDGLPGAVRDAGLDLTPEVAEKLVRVAETLRGFPRHLSIHPGGFLLGSEAIARLVPVQPATMPGRTIIQWDKTDVETMNLFKVDLLGLGALTHLDYAFQLLQKHHRRHLTLATIPGADSDVFDMLCRGDSQGVFQIESRAQMSMLPRLKPRTYYDLVVEISLVRPGPITGGMVHPYLRRRAGEEDITYPHPSLIPVLSKTLGIPLFQEQVMKLAMVAADYSAGEADQLRRDMAAWKQLGRIEGHHERIVGRMIAKGIEPEFAERVFAQIRGFGEYGFPESHAASFALIAYATAYLKHHHPDAFACALLNAWPMGFYAPSSIIGDAQRHGVEVRPALATHSAWDCTLEPGEGESRWAIRIGLRYIKGLVRTEAERVLATRSATLAEWKARSGVSSATWEKLAVSGALESLGGGRREALWQVLDLGLPVGTDLGFSLSPGTTFSPLEKADKVLWDYASMGHSTAGHVLQDYRPALDRQGFVTAALLALRPHRDRVTYAGIVICRQMPENANGVLFLSLEDETGLVSVVAWKKQWDEYRRVILTSPFLAISGTIQNEDGVVHLMAQRFWCPEGVLAPGSVTTPSHDFH